MHIDARVDVGSSRCWRNWPRSRKSGLRLHGLTREDLERCRPPSKTGRGKKKAASKKAGETGKKKAGRKKKSATDE
ncbi:MAG: hypothetical protein R6X02_32005 [Enhygromyxa sp.]